MIDAYNVLGVIEYKEIDATRLMERKQNLTPKRCFFRINEFILRSNGIDI